MYNPITSSNAFDYLIGKSANGVTKTNHNFFQCGENLISEAAPAQFLPYLFDWIHFRRIWWNKKQAYVFWNAKGAGLMPCSTITAKENYVVRILLCQVAQEEIYANCIIVWHDQETTLPGGRFDSSVGITIFADVMTRNRRANTLLAPAEFELVDSSKARFVLEHQAHFSAVSTAIVDFFFQFSYFFFNFFEAAMTSSLAFFGCLLRGITFRQPCRHSTR